MRLFNGNNYMKKNYNIRNMGKKIIRLTEKEQRKMIRESVKKVLEENKKGLIVEMPYHRGKYKDKVDAELPQVFTNWCLARYCTIKNIESHKKHWKENIKGHMRTAARYNLKGNDSIESRRKIFNEILSENDYDMPQFMSLTVCNKFIEEQINIKSEEYEQTIIDCIKNIRDIFELILNRNIQDIDSYADSI